jgi:hypothetical protein
MDEDGYDFEAVWAKDGQTFVIRKRTDMPWDPAIARNQPLARYVRLPASRSVSETLLLPLPLRARGVVSSEGKLPAIEHIARIVIEIGYLEGQAPARVRDNLEANDSNSPFTRYDGTRIPSILLFNMVNELRGNTDDEFLFYLDPARPTVKGERVLNASVEAEHIQLKESDSEKPSTPNLRNCDRLAISYEPSALDYFFPNENQRRLFDSTEMQKLRTVRGVVVNGQKDVNDFVRQIGRGSRQGITLRGAPAHVVCYQNNDRLAAIEMYADCFITEAAEPFSRPGPHDDGYVEDFRRLASWVRPFEVRVACSRNLRNLFRRFRFYTQAERSRVLRPAEDWKPEYPLSSRWCDSIADAYKGIGMLDEYVNRPFRCPSASDGKCHYAMNSDCTFDSPADTVLLFETRAGWNQDGGPGLFTFDNHDPKGGLVLLNDGTVKFIRTEEELKQLRWK